MLLGIKPSVTQTVTAGGTITFTLELEQGQDASTEFVGWIINGEPVPPQDPYNPEWYFLISGFNATIGAVYQQQVAGCEGLEVLLNESNSLKVWEVHCNVTAPEPYLEPWLHVANNWCAVNKIPEAGGAVCEKAYQHASIGDIPAEPCTRLHFDGSPPDYAMPWVAVDGDTWYEYDPHLNVDAHTSWQLEKKASYDKTIDWLDVTIDKETGPWVDCALFDLVPFDPECTDLYRLFVIHTEAHVELEDDEDIYPDNNWCDSADKQLYLMVTNPYQVGGVGHAGDGWTELGSDYDWQAKARHGGSGGWRAFVDDKWPPENILNKNPIPWLNGGQMWFQLVYDDSTGSANFTVYDSSDNSVLGTVTDPSVPGFDGLIGIQAKTSSEAAGSIVVDNVKMNGASLYGDDGFVAQGSDFVRDLKYLDISGVPPGSFTLAGNLTFTWGAKATDEGPSISIYMKNNF
jgi:hypothetical protein